MTNVVITLMFKNESWVRGEWNKETSNGSEAIGKIIEWTTQFGSQGQAPLRLALSDALAGGLWLRAGNIAHNLGFSFGYESAEISNFRPAIYWLSECSCCSNASERA